MIFQFVIVTVKLFLLKKRFQRVFYIIIFSKMDALNKHSFLQTRSCGINARIINRCVTRARDSIEYDLYDLQPYNNRLASEQPAIPLGEIDVTRRPLAFGRLAVTKLMKELHSKDPWIQLQAVTTFTDVLHHPEKGCEAVKLRVQDRMIDLLKHRDPAVRERVCMCLTIIAGLADGKYGIAKRKDMLTNLAELLTDQVVEVRMKLAICLEQVSRFWLAADKLVDHGFVEVLLKSTDDTTKIVAYHLRTLISLMYCDGTQIALKNNGFTIFKNLLKAKSPEIVALAAECLAHLISTPEGKQMALKTGLLMKLCSKLNDENPAVQEGVVAAIMYSTILTKGKIVASKIPHLPDRLLQLANNPLNTRLQLFCLKSLTNLCEYPKIRNYMQCNHIETIKKIQLARESDLMRYKSILLNVINWSATSST